jgi:outer membrane protein assembly factor BamB/tetratricopeptide (TPR) repeat protein
MKSSTAAVALLALAALGAPAAADDPFLPFQAPDRPDALRYKLDFEKYAKLGEWSTAVDKLQQLLDIPGDDPIVLRAKGFTPARFEGTGIVARRLFDSMPPEGVAAWEKLSRAHAEELLARGIRLRREADLHEAARRYPAPDVRRRAHEALAQLALVRGDLGAAQFQLESLYEASAPADRPQVLARLAWVCAQSGDSEGFESVRARAEAFHDAPTPSIGGVEPLAAFVARMQRSLAAGAAAWADARQFGGDFHGSGVSDPPPQPDVIRGRFVTEFQFGLLDDRDTEPFSTEFERSLMRPTIPVVSHGRVLSGNGLSILAVDLASVGVDMADGGAAWRFDAPQWSSGPYWRDNYVASCAPAVADGVVYAALASRSDQPAQDIQFNGYVIIYPLPHRCLYALDERTGDVIWSHDPSRLAGREDAYEMSKESVASPPLVVGDDVLVSTWTYEGIYDVRLVCFDRRTGRTRWRTSLVQGQQEMNLFGRPVKELVTSALAERGGRVFVATGLGAMAAVERADGRIAWLSQYRESEIPRAIQWHETRDRRVTWWPSPVSATPDGVVVAPMDAMELYCFDPADGTTKWRRPRIEGQQAYRWFLGAAGGRAYVLGDRAMAFDVKTGATAWTDVDAGRLRPTRSKSDVAAGRGILAKDRLYVPTTGSIVVLASDTGAIVENWPFVASAKGPTPTAGDLVSGDGALLVVNRDRVDVVFRPEELRARYAARLKQNPDDPQVCLEAGQAFAADGRFDEAVATLDNGFRRLPQSASRARDRLDGALRRALYQARTDRADARRRAKDYAGAAEDLRAAAAVAREKGDAVRALFALADVLAEAGRRDESEDALRRVATEFGDVVTTAESGDRAAAGALALFRLGESALAAGKPVDAVARWLDLLEQRGDDDLGAADVATTVRARLAELAKTEPSLVAAAVHARAKKAFEKARAAGDVAAIGRVSRLYPDDQDVAVESALLAADMHVAAGRHREAVGVLTALLATPRPAIVAGRALWKLSLAYRALGETARERATLRRLADEAPLELVDGATNGADAAKRELAAPRFHGAGVRLPDPRPPLSLRWQEGGADQTAAQARVPAGSAPEDLEGRLVLTRSGVVSVVDATNGKPAWEQSMKIDARPVFGAPGAIVVVGEDGTARERGVAVMAYSTTDGREVWRKRLPGRYWKCDASLGVLYLLQIQSGAGGGGKATYSLTAMSLSSGELLGAPKSFAQLLPQIVPAEDALVLVEPTRRQDGVKRSLIVLDGMTLAQRGRFELANPSSIYYAHPPLSTIVVTSDGDDLVAVDVTNGEKAWKSPAKIGQGRSIKAVFPVTAGLVVSDTGDSIRLLDAEEGRERWNTPLAATGALMFDGEAAEGDLVVATVKPKSGPAVAVALDAATGKERWRTALPLTDENAYPHPRILASIVAYEVSERLDQGGARSRVLLVDRANGKIVQEIEHPTIGKSYETVVYGPDWIAVNSTNELAVYGSPVRGK